MAKKPGVGSMLCIFINVYLFIYLNWLLGFHGWFLAGSCAGGILGFLNIFLTSAEQMGAERRAWAGGLGREHVFLLMADALIFCADDKLARDSIVSLPCSSATFSLIESNLGSFLSPPSYPHLSLHLSLTHTHTHTHPGKCVCVCVCKREREIDNYCSNMA